MAIFPRGAILQRYIADTASFIGLTELTDRELVEGLDFLVDLGDACFNTDGCTECITLSAETCDGDYARYMGGEADTASCNDQCCVGELGGDHTDSISRIAAGRTPGILTGK